MADTYTSTLRLQQPTIGGDAATWGGFLNTDLVLIDNAINGVATINIAGLSAYTLTVGNGTVDQARNQVYNFTGALSGNCTVTLPQSVKFGYAVNSTTGGHNVILTTGSGGSTLTLPTAAWYQFFYCDSSNVVSPSIGFGYANFLNSVSISGTLAVTGNVTLSGTLNGQAINGATVYGASSVNCGPSGWYVIPNGDQHIPYLNGNLSGFLNQPVTVGSSPTFADVGLAGVGFLKASFINQPVMTTSTPTFSNIYLSYLGYISNFLNQAVTVNSTPNFNNVYFGYFGDYLSNVVNQRVRTVDSPSFANVTINGVGTVWGTLLNQQVLTSSQPTFNNVILGYLGDAISNRLNQSVVTNSQPTFNNVFISVLGNWINNLINQDLRTGSSPTFSGVTVNGITTNFSTANGGGTAYHAPNGSGVAAGGWFTGSDASYKSNVKTLTGALGKVMSLRGVSYTHNELGGEHIGVIAQETQEHFPEVVTEHDGKLSVNYNALVAPLIEAIKELADKVERIGDDLSDLRQELAL